MPRHPLVVKGRLWHQDALVDAALGIDPESGRITAIARDLDGDVVHDHGTAWILPGGVDVHVHLRDPGAPQKEDLESGTRSALVGGTTTVYDMPNTDPATTTRAAYEAKQDTARRKAVTDWGLYAGATRPGPDLDALLPLAPGLKLYLGESTGCVTLEAPEMLPAILDQLDAAGWQGVLVVHAEARQVLEAAGKTHRDAPGLEGHARRRPVEGEMAALEQLAAATTGRRTRYRVHVAHVSSPRLLDLVDRPRWTFGVTPNHLFLHHALPLGARGRMNPPLRSEDERRVLLAAFAAGDVPIVESDHAPHTVEEKARDVREAPSGIPGVGTLRPLLLAEVAAGRLSLARVVAATSERPADLFRLPKGRIEVGRHADLAVHDPKATRPIEAARLESRCGWTPYEGRPGLFPTHVYLRGTQVVADGVVVAPAGIGREARAEVPG